jgi:hypothetical protein
MIAAASPAGGEIRPGMIAVVQTAGCDLGWHPHVHPLVTRGGWDRAGQCVPVPFVDGETAALMVRHKAILFLKAEGLLSEERARLLLSWRHTGLQGHRDTDAGQDTQPPPNPRRFGPMHGQPASCPPPCLREVSVHTSVTVPPDERDGLERLARYLLRAPVSLERLHVDEQAHAIACAARSRPSHGATAPTEPVDAKDFLAHALMHIPDPRHHVIWYYGASSNVARARRRREAMPAGASDAARFTSVAIPEGEPIDLDLRALRRRWVQLIRRIDEVDPLVCLRCGAEIRIIAFTSRGSGGAVRRGLQHCGPMLRGLGWGLCDAVARLRAVLPHHRAEGDPQDPAAPGRQGHRCSQPARPPGAPPDPGLTPRGPPRRPPLRRPRRHSEGLPGRPARQGFLGSALPHGLGSRSGNSLPAPSDPIQNPPGTLTAPLTGLPSAQVRKETPIHSSPSSAHSSTATASAPRPRHGTLSSGPSRASTTPAAATPPSATIHPCPTKGATTPALWAKARDCPPSRGNSTPPAERSFYPRMKP